MIALTFSLPEGKIEIILSATNWISTGAARGVQVFFFFFCYRDGQYSLMCIACRQPKIRLPSVSDLWLKPSSPSQTIKTSFNFSHAIRVRNLVIEYREQYKRSSWQRNRTLTTAIILGIFNQFCSNFLFVRKIFDAAFFLLIEKVILVYKYQSYGDF